MFIPERRFVRRYERPEIKRITPEFIRGFPSWITPRDEYLLELLLSYKPNIKTFILNTNQIEILVYSKKICKNCWSIDYHLDKCSKCGGKVFWGSKPSSWRNIANKSLRQLFENYCIDRFEPPVGRNEGSSPQHVILDKAGAMWIIKKLNIERLKWRKLTYIPQTYQHDLKILDFYCALELDRMKNPHGEIVFWQQDPYTKRTFQLNNKRYFFRPDAFVIYKYTERRIKPLFIECDNATEGIERLKGKIRMYDNYFRSGYWRQEFWANYLPNTFPLVLFLSHENMTELKEFVRRKNSPVKFIFATYDQLVQSKYKEYTNRRGKIRKVLQEIDSRILEIINP